MILLTFTINLHTITKSGKINFLPVFGNLTLLICVCFLFLNQALAQTQSDTIAKSLPESIEESLGYFELNIGPEVRHARGSYFDNNKSGTSVYNASAFGWTGRMQNSFLANLFPEKKHFLQTFDLLSGELTLGGLTTGNPNESSGIWLAYRFDFGIGNIIRLGKNNELGLNLALLKFSRDKISPNISGSGLKIRYRCYHVQAEAGMEARRERMFGYFMKDVPLQFTGSLRYLFQGRKQAGLLIENLSGNRNILHSGGLDVKNIWALRIFYGIYF